MACDIGQVARETTTGKFYCWDGSSWAAVKAGGSVNTITPTTGGSAAIQSLPDGHEVSISCVFNDTTTPFIAGPTAEMEAQSPPDKSLATDLPTASAVEKGAVEVQAVAWRWTGETIKIDNTVVPSTATSTWPTLTPTVWWWRYKLIESQDLPVCYRCSAGCSSPRRRPSHAMGR